MSVAVAKEVRVLAVDVEHNCAVTADCRRLVENDYVDTFYANPPEPLSVAVLPDTGHGYEMGTSRVARQNARVAARAGYRYERIDRAEWEDDLHELRSSASRRQGRPMPMSYMQRQRYGSDAWPEPHCKRHLVTVHGVISPEGHLVAYAQVVQCGDVVRFNTILGHADHLEQRVMWLLVMKLVQWHIDVCGARFALYYTHESGHGDGLMYFKERFGMRPSKVTWVL